jgi:type II secretory pathway pseudopilin PulG
MIRGTQSETSGAVAAARGFALIELALALVIVALFLGAIMVPLTTQVEQRKISDTQRTVEDIKEALIGFAIVNGRLPCPAAPSATGTESPAGGGVCTNFYNGFVPGATLGLTPTDDQGYAIDGWGQRLHYAVSTAGGTNAFTTVGGMRAQGLSLAGDLAVCSASPPGPGPFTVCNPATSSLASAAVVVIYSLGPNWATGGVNADEAANLTIIDQVFVFHTRTTTPNGGFDDIVTWLSTGVLYSRMVNAAVLP